MPINDFITAILNIKDEDIEKVETVKIDNILNIYLTLKNTTPVCPYCGGKSVIKGYLTNKIHITDIASFNSLLFFRKRRYICKYCQKTFIEKNPFGPNNTNVSWNTLVSIMNDLSNLSYTYKNIADRHHISITRVQLYADSYLKVPRLPLPASIGIDELHSNLAKYKSPYLGVIVDNENRDLLEILPSRSKECLGRYFNRIPREERLNVKYVTIDLWKPYREVAKTYLPKAKITADPFHVVKNLMDGFTKHRVSIMNQSPYGSTNYYLLKKWHKLLESDYNFDPCALKKYNNHFHQKLNYYDLLELLLRIDSDLTLAYELKEDYRRFNKETTSENAREEFEKIYTKFVHANLPFYYNFIEILKEWKEEIIASFDRPYDNRKQTNALAENMNEKLRIMITNSNGLKNYERFRDRALYSLNKKVHYSITDKFYSKKVTKKEKKQ